MAADYVMKVSRNGQVSIPAEVRARWRADDSYVPDEVVVVDMGDHVVIGPSLVDPVSALAGAVKRRARLTTDELRRRDRAEEAERDSVRRRTASKRARSA